MFTVWCLQFWLIPMWRMKFRDYLDLKIRYPKSQDWSSFLRLILQCCLCQISKPLWENTCHFIPAPGIPGGFTPWPRLAAKPAHFGALIWTRVLPRKVRVQNVSSGAETLPTRMMNLMSWGSMVDHGRWKSTAGSNGSIMKKQPLQQIYHHQYRFLPVSTFPEKGAHSSCMWDHQDMRPHVDHPCSLQPVDKSWELYCQ